MGYSVEMRESVIKKVLFGEKTHCFVYRDESQHYHETHNDD